MSMFAFGCRCLELGFLVCLEPFCLRCYVPNDAKWAKSKMGVGGPLARGSLAYHHEGLGPPSERLEKRNKSDVSRTSRAPKAVHKNSQEKIHVSVSRK